MGEGRISLDPENLEIARRRDLPCNPDSLVRKAEAWEASREAESTRQHKHANLGVSWCHSTATSLTSLLASQGVSFINVFAFR